MRCFLFILIALTTSHCTFKKAKTTAPPLKESKDVLSEFDEDYRACVRQLCAASKDHNKEAILNQLAQEPVGQFSETIDLLAKAFEKLAKEEATSSQVQLTNAKEMESLLQASLSRTESIFLATKLALKTYLGGFFFVGEIVEVSEKNRFYKYIPTVDYEKSLHKTMNSKDEPLASLAYISSKLVHSLDIAELLVVKLSWGNNIEEFYISKHGSLSAALQQEIKGWQKIRKRLSRIPRKFSIRLGIRDDLVDALIQGRTVAKSDIELLYTQSRFASIYLSVLEQVDRDLDPRPALRQKFAESNLQKHASAIAEKITKKSDEVISSLVSSFRKELELMIKTGIDEDLLTELKPKIAKTRQSALEAGIQGLSDELQQQIRVKVNRVAVLFPDTKDEIIRKLTDRLGYKHSTVQRETALQDDFTKLSLLLDLIYIKLYSWDKSVFGRSHSLITAMTNKIHAIVDYASQAQPVVMMSWWSAKTPLGPTALRHEFGHHVDIAIREASFGSKDFAIYNQRFECLRKLHVDDPGGEPSPIQGVNFEEGKYSREDYADLIAALSTSETDNEEVDIGCFSLMTPTEIKEGGLTNKKPDSHSSPFFRAMHHATVKSKLPSECQSYLAKAYPKYSLRSCQ